MKAFALALAIAGAAIGLTFCAFYLGAVVAQAWLCAFVLVSMVPVGSVVLLLVHGITGGRWGCDIAPAIVPAARCMPLLIFAFAPILLARPVIYRWHELDLPPDVTRYYLNPLFFDLRTLIALVTWSALAWSGAWRNQLLAGLGLIFHVVLVTFVPADWVLTLPPGSTSAGFGLGFGIEQIGAALAFAAVVAPQQPEPRPDSDLAGLLITTLLATTYFVYMQFLIIWYGNIPEKVHWYVTRAGHGWSAVALTAFLIGAALPFLAMLNPTVRRTRPTLRVVGALMLTGIALHVVWLTVPAFGAPALIPAVLAVMLMVLLIQALRRFSSIGRAGHAG